MAFQIVFFSGEGGQFGDYPSANNVFASGIGSGAFAVEPEELEPSFKQVK